MGVSPATRPTTGFIVEFTAGQQGSDFLRFTSALANSVHDDRSRWSERVPASEGKAVRPCRGMRALGPCGRHTCRGVLHDKRLRHWGGGGHLQPHHRPSRPVRRFGLDGEVRRFQRSAGDKRKWRHLQGHLAQRQPLRQLRGRGHDDEHARRRHLLDLGDGLRHLRGDRVLGLHAEGHHHPYRSDRPVWELGYDGGVGFFQRSARDEWQRRDVQRHREHQPFRQLRGRGYDDRPASVGTYTISGTDSDSLGDAGAWTYTLTVSVAAITQVAPFGKSVSTTASSAFSDDVATNGSGVIFNAVANADLSVSSSGKVTTPGALAVGDYSISGTDSDSLGDAGTWSYTLTVTAVPITQDAPFWRFGHGGIRLQQPAGNERHQRGLQP